MIETSFFDITISAETVEELAEKVTEHREIPATAGVEDGKLVVTDWWCETSELNQ